jgi:tetratricopeptide (TPR) repeat protein
MPARSINSARPTSLSIDRPMPKRSLRRAEAISPADPEIQMHLGRALMESGHEEEGRRLLAGFQTNRSPRARGPWKQPGMIETAGLPPEERGKREIERLRQDARAHPDDPELQLRLASLLLTEGRREEAMAEFRVLLTRNAENRTWQQAGTFLLSFEQYSVAREFLERATATDPAANLDLTAAIFFTDGPEKALRTLENLPEAQRSGDYFLLKARLLDAAGRAAEAEALLDQGLRLSISRPRLVKDAVLLLVRHDRNRQALELLDKAAGKDPDLLLMRAIVLAFSDRQDSAEKAAKEIEAKWPEWDRPYLVHALLLERTQPRDAGSRLPWPWVRVT